MGRVWKQWSILLLGGVLATGCSTGGPSEGPSADKGAGAKYLLAEEPAGARGVKDVREESRDGDEVVVVGRIGGTKKPFSDDRASFTIVDSSLKSCLDRGETDAEAPWEFD
jgi:hypothetical protein